MSHQKLIPQTESPMGDLKEIIKRGGDDMQKLFATSLTIFAGAQASFKSEDEKSDELETVLLRD